MADDPLTLSKRGTINWPERITRLEVQVSEFREWMQSLQEQHQIEVARYAEAMERIANHLEDGKRVYTRIEAAEARLAEQQAELREIKTQLAHAIEFQKDAKRIALMVVTGGAVVLWWVIQKWLEHGR